MSIRFENVHKSFGNRKILKGVYFEIPKGKTTVVFGVSGGGKSTIIKHIVGLLYPDEGNIFVDDDCVNKADEKTLLKIRKKVGFLFQHGALFDSMSVEENIAFVLREHKMVTKNEIEGRIDELLSMVGLNPTDVKKLFPDELSGGMRKRVGLARTLALEPQTLLYDEPTSGLDPVTSDFISQMIKKLQKELNVTSILISHDMGESFKVGDYFMMLFDGKIVDFGDAHHIKNSKHPAVIQFLNGEAHGPIKFS
jgi:phospholipid/cholesterol/gamma-HCH transport system ATP-binding protein